MNDDDKIRTREQIMDMIAHGTPFEAAIASEELKNLSPTPPTPIYRGDLAEVRSQLSEVLAKLQTPNGTPPAPAFSVLDFIRLMTDIERAALDCAWQSVPKNAPTAQLADWLARGEVIARYMRRRLELPESTVPQVPPQVPPQN